MSNFHITIPVLKGWCLITDCGCCFLVPLIDVNNLLKHSLKIFLGDFYHRQWHFGALYGVTTVTCFQWMIESHGMPHYLMHPTIVYGRGLHGPQFTGPARPGPADIVARPGPWPATIKKLWPVLTRPTMKLARARPVACQIYELMARPSLARHEGGPGPARPSPANRSISWLLSPSSTL